MSVAPAAPKTVFISYSSRDREDAIAIKQLLESNNLNVWLDYFNIETSAELREELAARVRQSDLFCLLLSPSAVESHWVNDEIEVALAARKAGLRVLPVLLRPCAIPAQLDNIVGFDASDGLKREAVRLRLLRAVCGQATVEEGILIDATHRMLLADKEKVLSAEAELPKVAEILAPAAVVPLRKVTLEIAPESLPENPDVILELQLRLDNLFHGTMSFFIARYQEGKTWPEEFGFEEPPYTEFFLQPRPRIDVVFQWFSRTVRLDPDLDGTDLKLLPATFRMEFDGAEFQPKGEFNLAQTFEIPSLDALEKQNSAFRLLAHDTAVKEVREVSGETDIAVSLFGEAGDHHVCLYTSRLTRDERLLLGSAYLSDVKSPIRRSALLRRYLPLPVEDRVPEIEAALAKGEFQSDEQRRLAARYRYGKALLARFRTLHRDAYVEFQETAELLQPLVLERKPSLEDATLMYLACRAVVETWLRQDSIPQAAQVAETLTSVARSIADADTANPDFQRMWAEAALISADISAKLGETALAAEALSSAVEVQRALYAALPSLQRRLAFVQALTGGIQRALEWKAGDAVPLEEWKAALKAEGGETATEARIEGSAGDRLPPWLEAADPPGWPTLEVENATLRYAVRIPKRWGTDFEVRGTAREVEHVYRGRSDAEWLIVSFMEKANDTSDMRNWVQTYVDVSGFPVILKLEPAPALRTLTYVGKLAALAKKLDVDEAHAYTGLASYTLDKHAILGRIYIVMARRRTFAWKLALSIETACFEGMPEEIVTSQDHVRAGATFGTLRLGDAAPAGPGSSAQ